MLKNMNLVGIQQNQDDSLKFSEEDYSIISNPSLEIGELFNLVNESVSNSESNSTFDINSVKSGLSSASCAPSSGLLMNTILVLQEENVTLKTENAALKDQLAQSSKKMNEFIDSVMKWRSEMTTQNADIRLKLETSGKEIKRLKNENAELRKTDAATEQCKNNIVPNHEHALNGELEQIKKKLEELKKSSSDSTSKKCAVTQVEKVEELKVELCTVSQERDASQKEVSRLSSLTQSVSLCNICKQGANNLIEGNSSLQEHQSHPLKSKKLEIIQRGSVYICNVCQTTFLSLTAFEKHIRNCLELGY